MIISGSESLSEQEFLGHVWKARTDEACTELRFENFEFDMHAVSILIDILPSMEKQWDSVVLHNCSGGSIVNDIIWCICTSRNIREFVLHCGVTSSVDRMTFQALTYGLTYSRQLTSIRLNIRVIDQEASNLLSRAIARNTWLQTLDFGGSSFTESAMSPLAFGLRLNRSVKRLRLDGCELPDESIALIIKALQDHPALKSLSITQNSCHNEGMGAIAGLLHFNTSLEELDMSYLVRKRKEPPAAAQSETKEEEQAPTEEEKVEDEEDVKDTDDAEKEDEGPSDEIKDESKEEEGAIQETVKEEEDNEADDARRVRNTTLKSFYLAGNSLNDDFVESMLNVFGDNSQLQELNLFGNRITDSGLLKIICTIPKLQHLERLWIGQNCFSNSLLSHGLLPLLKENYSLQEINIRSLVDDSETDKVQLQLDFYCRLNRGGRRIFANDKSSIPLGLWPKIMERAHNIYWGAATSNTSTHIHHTADLLYCLLHGPVIFENNKILLNS